MPTATDATTTRPPTNQPPRGGEARAEVPTALPLLGIAAATPRPGVLVLQVSGELDLASAPELDVRVQQEIRGRGPHLLIIDLSRLRFLGLQGIAVVERLRRRAGAAEIGLSLVGLTPAGARALEFAGVLPHFARYPDVATALVAAEARTAVTPGATP